MHQHQQQQEQQHSNRFSSQSAPTELQVIISSCSIAIELLPRKEQQTRTRLKRCNEWKSYCWTKITKSHGTETKKRRQRKCLPWKITQIWNDDGIESIRIMSEDKNHWPEQSTAQRARCHRHHQPHRRHYLHRQHLWRRPLLQPARRQLVHSHP